MLCCTILCIVLLYIIYNEFLTDSLSKYTQVVLKKDQNSSSCDCQVTEYLNIYVPSIMDELPIEQSRSQPVNPSHVTINGLTHYCTHNASVNNSI